MKTCTLARKVQCLVRYVCSGMQKIAMSEENQEMVKHKVSRSLGVIDFKIKIFFGVNLLGL